MDLWWIYYALIINSLAEPNGWIYWWNINQVSRRLEVSFRPRRSYTGDRIDGFFWCVLFFLFRPIFIPVLCGRGIDRQRLTGKLSYRIAGSIVYLTRVLLEGEGDPKDGAFVFKLGREFVMVN